MAGVTGLCLGLFAAWAVNDVEELCTMRADSRRLLAALPSPLRPPQALVESGVSQAHVTTAIALMGAGVAAAAVDGVRSGGRSALFQTVLLGFGLHGFGHLAASARAGRMTSGAWTSPTVVIPYWVWASRALRRSGIDPLARVSWPLLAATPAVIGSAHALAWLVRRAAGVRRPLLDESR